jgi:hypothetical protein
MSVQHKTDRDKFIAYLKINIAYLKRRNSILTLKSSYIKQKHDIVNVITIVVSTLLTCFETIRLEFGLEQSDNVYIQRSATLIPLIFTSYIAISMSILKFCRYTDMLEEHTKVTEKCVFVICRLRRVVEDAYMTQSEEELKETKVSYSKNPFDLYIDARECLDRTLKYTDVLQYGKLLDDFVDDIDNDIKWYNRLCVFTCCRRKRPLNPPPPSIISPSARSMSMVDIFSPPSSRESSPLA